MECVFGYWGEFYRKVHLQAFLLQTRECSLSLSLSLSLSHAHTHTYTYIDTHAHTYTHIHARALSHKTNFSVFEKHSELNKREPMPTFSIIPQATRSRWKLEAAQHVIVSLD